ncbi:MAG: cytochrome c biogenesis protein CcsA [Fimbriimonadaceae bacterium]|nr:cytochrome c biogenesis protein CcsA [Fimbriimonadaceae bacterium]
MNATPTPLPAGLRPLPLPALVLLGVWLLGCTACGFAVPMPDGRGFQDIEGYRAVFFHVPLAWCGCLSFMAAAWHGVRYLTSRRLICDAAAYAAAESGLVLCVLATLTGMIFAQQQWGKAWNWDPRQTSIFFVLLIYAAYLVLRQALGEDEALRARFGAAYLLLAVAPMVWLVAVFPRTVPASLHPEQAPFDAVHWRLMFANFAGLIGVWGVLMRLQVAAASLRLAARERW